MFPLFCSLPVSHSLPFCPTATLPGVAEQGEPLGGPGPSAGRRHPHWGTGCRGYRAPGKRRRSLRAGCWRASWLRDAVLGLRRSTAWKAPAPCVRRASEGEGWRIHIGPSPRGAGPGQWEPGLPLWKGSFQWGGRKQPEPTRRGGAAIRGLHVHSSFSACVCTCARKGRQISMHMFVCERLCTHLHASTVGFSNIPRAVVH